jgi:DNA-binding transcriptional LysR family regulator
MSLSEPEDCVPLLRSGELDLAIVFESAVKHADDGIHRVHLLEDPMYLVLPRDHPLANRRRVRLADLAGEAWIGGQPDCECNRLILRACATAGYDPRFAFETDDYTAMQGFVAAGVGVSLIAELGLTTVRDDIVVRDLGRDTPVRQIYAATLEEGYRSPATQAMLEILRDVASRYESRRPRLELVG